MLNRLSPGLPILYKIHRVFRWRDQTFRRTHLGILAEAIEDIVKRAIKERFLFRVERHGVKTTHPNRYRLGLFRGNRAPPPPIVKFPTNSF